MMMLIEVLAVSFAVLFAACGGGVGEPSTDTVGISDKMAGAWVGNITVSRSGSAPRSRSSEIHTTKTDATHIVVSGFCEAASSGPEIAGEGTRVSLVDPFVCPTIVADVDCENAVYVFTELDVSVFSGNSINVAGAGTVSGCGQVVSFTLNFDGTRVSAEPPVGVVHY